MNDGKHLCSVQLAETLVRLGRLLSLVDERMSAENEARAQKAFRRALTIQRSLGLYTAAADSCQVSV